MEPFKIAIIGECMVELQRRGVSLKQSFGGDTLNTALYLARLADTKKLGVSYVTALGEDPFSQQMVQAWQAEGVDTHLVLRLKDKMPGLYHIETDDNGERRFFYWRSDSAAKYMFEQPESTYLIEALMTYHAVYLSGITLAILTKQGRDTLFEVLQTFKQRGGKVFFDNNYRPLLWASKDEAEKYHREILKLTDIALLTFDDEQALFGDEKVEQCITRAKQLGVAEVVVKQGDKACIVVSENGMDHISPNKVESVIDTTAAGDSFSAGYLARRLTGGNPAQSAIMGHKLAGEVIQHRGAIIPKFATPTIDEV